MSCMDYDIFCTVSSTMQFSVDRQHVHQLLAADAAGLGELLIYMLIVYTVMLDTSLAVTSLQFSQVVCRKSHKYETSPSMMYEYAV